VNYLVGFIDRDFSSLSGQMNGVNFLKFICRPITGSS